MNLQEWEARVDAMSPREAGERLTEDYFKIHLRNIHWEKRENLLVEAEGLFGFSQAEEMGAEFRVRRAAEPLSHGYGQYVLPRSYFMGADEETIYRGLNLITPSVQVQDEALYPEGHRRLSSSLMRDRFKRTAAQQAARPADVLGKSRIMFDIETAGTEGHDRIWQLAARMVDEGGEERTLNLVFDNPYMDLGVYMHPETNQPISWQEMYRIKNGEAPRMRGFAEGIDEFLKFAENADFLAGQNVSFDISMLIHGMEGLKQQGKMTPEMLSRYEGFLTKVQNYDVLDTRLLSMMWFGEGIGVSQHLPPGQATAYAMENILLETNLLDIYEEELARTQFGGDRARAAARLDDILTRGTHLADVDIQLQDVLLDRILRGLAGEDVGLEAQPLTNQARIAAIARSAAITPFTNVVDHPQFGAMTPFEHMVRMERTFGHARGALDPEQVSRNVGLFSNWLREEEVLERTGRISPNTRLSHLGRGVQAKALEAGVPYAGISNAERILTTLLSRLSAGTTVRELFGELSGTSVFRAAETAHLGRNVALSMNILQELEGRGLIDTNLRGAMSGDVLQMARISTVEGTKTTGLALNVDLFDTGLDLDVRQSKLEDVRTFLNRLRREHRDGVYGPKFSESISLSPKELDALDEIVPRLDANVLKYGVQIGFMEGHSPSGMKSFINLMKQLGLSVDDPNKMSLLTPILGADEAGVRTGATLVGSGLEDMTDWLLKENQAARAADAVVEGMDENRAVRWAASYARDLGIDQAQAYKATSRVLGTLTKKNVALGAAAATGYYLFRKKREQDKYDAVMDFQGYEPGNQMTRTTPLQTAGLVQGLDRSKVGHHRMGKDKYAELY